MTSCLLDRRSNQLSYGAVHQITTCSIVYLSIYLLFFKNNKSVVKIIVNSTKLVTYPLSRLIIPRNTKMVQHDMII